jgi:cation diffusion facilitator CzcD-associated flavoprotein CzcO
MSQPTVTHDILVIGTGFAGLAMGVRLKQAGMNDFAILEQAEDVGGTWRDNHYPGAACDVQSHLYSFSFAPNPEWSRMFAEQREIWAYLRRCADDHDLRRHIRFGCKVTGARWDEATSTWTLTTAAGERLRARVVVSGTGGLSRPQLPDIPGLDRFAGAMFHSARWDHDTPLDGKTVGVIGTGASAIQIVPSIAPRVGRLHLFQRTPPWILAKPDRAIGPLEKALYRRLPLVQQAYRARIYLQNELRAVAFVLRPDVLRWAQKFAVRHLESQVADPALRRKLLPDYTMGCKRILMSNDYYPAVARPNVELVTDGIREITARGVVTADGRERALDALVLATGFQAAEATAPFDIVGRGGRSLDAAWRDGAEAYLGTTVHGFPNWFMVIGPNTGLGHSSMVLMIESQVAYIVDALRVMRRRGLAAVEVRRAVQDEHNAWLAKRHERTVWSSGCMSWYRTASGKNTTIWPGFTFEYRLRTRRFDAEAYHLETAAAADRRGARAAAAVAA